MRNSFDILKYPRVTEKATRLSHEENQYTFCVSKNANKIEIKHAIQELFNKTVVSVHTMKVLGKKKRGKSLHSGKKPDWKKAIVTLKKGEKIDFT